MTMSRTEVSRLGGLARAKQRTREDQAAAGRARAQKMTKEERVEFARKGWNAACSKVGAGNVIQRIIERQRANPSPIEREVLDYCRGRGWNVEHIYRPWNDRAFTVDIADPANKIAIEVLGPLHFLPFTADQRHYLEEKVTRLVNEGWNVLLLPCPDNRLPDGALELVEAVIPDYATVPF